jgi:hypothetical protein
MGNIGVVNNQHTVKLSSYFQFYYIAVYWNIKLWQIRNYNVFFNPAGKQLILLAYFLLINEFCPLLKDVLGGRP